MIQPLLRVRSFADVLRSPHDVGDAVDATTLTQAAAIVDDVRAQGQRAVRHYAAKFGELRDDQPLFLDRRQLERACDNLPHADRQVLERVAQRIARFAQAQRGCLVDLTTTIAGGSAGHTFSPVDRAGCYAPGGRFPLPSSVLMTAVTARCAGVGEVIVASPRPTIVTQAACAIAGADALLCVGGAHAIAALAYGVDGCNAVDVIVGPGNRWVTAAKHIVSAHVGIDMLAGPSELVVIADESALPATVAADLLAQAEHDPDALPVLLCTDQAIITHVQDELARQLANLHTRDTAAAALKNGYVVHVASLDDARLLADAIAAEHLELHVRAPQDLAKQVRHYGGLFVGHSAAEVFGDYGIGPNHVLPTGRRARYTGGLSVLHFLRMRTFMAIGDGEQDRNAVADCVRLAEMEGLDAHAKAAARRL